MTRPENKSHLASTPNSRMANLQITKEPVSRLTKMQSNEVSKTLMSSRPKAQSSHFKSMGQ